MVEVADCNVADMRLVIGRDLVRAKVALQPARPACFPAETGSCWLLIPS
ncbi:MAG TPA: hypothetical protein VF861_00590 [Telluria sp.]